MAAKLLVILSVAALAAALPAPSLEPSAPAHYEFQYSVHDTHTGDIKQQKEARQGDAVQGSYSLLQPDGLTRVVEYVADKEHGFVANVRYEGHPTSAPAPTPVVYSAPKVAYAPVAKVAYVAPKVVYSAPKVVYSAPKVAYTPIAKVAYPDKVAYTENLGHFTFSSPIISYHH